MLHIAFKTMQRKAETFRGKCNMVAKSVNFGAGLSEFESLYILIGNSVNSL